ncbi:MAG: dihydropteroate synthase [Endomicrobium sp.]|jgi:dihydropteroate synthase|nr:dihydropteroate synthase [Endomicrobium sp.]
MIVRNVVVNNLDDALKLVKNTGCSVRVYDSLAKRGIIESIIIEKLDNRAINILKQEVISVGAGAAVNENIVRFKRGLSDVVLFATLNQIEKLIKKISLQPFGLREVASKLGDVVNKAAKKKFFKYRQKSLNLSNPVVMGIINMDPNSFSGDGCTDPQKALRQAVAFEEFGAKIIDIGAESSRPGSRFIDAKTEIKRLIPAIKKIKKNVSIPISVDTYKYETAKIALSEGADIVNDIFALRKGKEKMAKCVVDAKAGLILMHMKGMPKDMQICPKYKNCVSEVYGFLDKQKKYAMSFGVEDDYIAVDPGPGFGKTVEHNVELIKNMHIFSTLGVVVGAVSRKKFVKLVAGDDKTAFVTANFLTAFCGADIIRTHDVKETVNVLKIIEFFRKV